LADLVTLTHAYCNMIQVLILVIRVNSIYIL